MTTLNQNKEVADNSAKLDYIRYQIDIINQGRPGPTPVSVIGIPTNLLYSFNFEQKSLIKRPLRTANIRSILGKPY